jgi:polyketide synthase 7
MSRCGFIPMSSADGLALFDAALRLGHSFVVPAQLNLAAIRSHVAVGGLPPLFRGLVRAARRTVDSTVAVESSSDLRQRLSAMSTSEREHELLAIVRSNAAAVLGHDSSDAVDADQEFKEVGFDSLGAVEFRNRLKSATGLKLPTTAVFDHPTSTALARYLARALDTDAARARGDEESGRIQQEYLPLTGYQRDIVAMSARYPDLPIAHVVAHARLDGTVNPDRMRECVRRAHLRNDALRLRFEFRDGEFVQHVGTELPELEFIDFTGDADPAVACRRWIDEASARVLPLNGPLSRAAVLVDRTDSFVVYACFHHAVADAWGINLALSQMLNDYVSQADTSSDHDVEAPRYVEFVRTEREYRASPDWEADRDYFLEEYRDVEPALFARSGSVRSRRRRHHTMRVNPKTAQHIRETGRSIFAFTAAAIGEYLNRIHRSRDIIIGVPLLNRSSEAELRTVGCMTSMLPLRIPVDDSLSMAELADQITAQVWELQARQRFAYGDLVTAMQDSAGGLSTFFDVTYSYFTIPDSEHAEWIWKDASVLASGYSLDAVNIVVREYERDGSLEVDLFYADDVFDANYRFADALRHVLTLINEALDAPEMPIGDIDMFSPADRAELTAFAYGAQIDA